MKQDNNKSSFGRISIFIYISVSLSFLNCDIESNDDIADDDDACTDIGDQDPCTCQSGLSGLRTCYPDLRYSECQCEIKEELTPCDTPGVDYACRCDDDHEGILFCEDNGIFSECFCDGSPSESDNGTFGGSYAGGSDNCPEPYSCVEIEGVYLCADAAGIPPFCENNDDCVAAGLDDGQCLDPSNLGEKICIKVCED